MSEQLAPPVAESSDPTTDACMKWLTKNYESMEQWKNLARDVFFSVNGESNVARNRVASMLRSRFLSIDEQETVVTRWKEGLADSEQVAIPVPKINASNASYIDWVFLADYLLLACASLSDRLETENQKRESEFQLAEGSFALRSIIYAARRKMQQEAELSDEEILLQVRQEYPKAAMANVKEARKLERGKFKIQVPIAPKQGTPLARYVSLYL